MLEEFHQRIRQVPGFHSDGASEETLIKAQWAGMGGSDKEVEAPKGFQRREAVPCRRPDGMEGEAGAAEAQGQ